MSLNPAPSHTSYIRSETLGNEITELVGFITAATYDPVRPFPVWLRSDDCGLTFSGTDE